MNNPKEKAKELVDRFDVVGGYGIGLKGKKDCAIICVNEIIDTYTSPLYNDEIKDWQEVLNEIIKL